MFQLVERGFFKSPAIQLSDGPGSVNPPVQVLRVGKFNHPKYGEFEITTLTLQEMLANFNARVRGVDVAFDYFHDSDKEASGWPTELYLMHEGTELWAKVDWTPAAQKKLGEREIRYFSPDFAFKWTDPETGTSFNNVLFGGGLTNRPFVKDMAAIVAHEPKGKKKMDEKDKLLLEKVLKLAEDNAEGMKKMQSEQLAQKAHLEKLGAMPTAPAAPGAVPPPAAAKPKLEDPQDDGSDPDQDEDEESDDPVVLKKQLAEMKKKLAEYAEKNVKAEEAKQMSEKKSAFNVMLSEGKVCVAQQKAFMSGDMAAFAKLAQPVNLSAKGATHLNTTVASDGSREDRVMKLAEEKCKAEKGLSLVDAITLANKETPKE